MLIKICGVRDPEIAHFAASCGATFIGMILTPGFERSVTLEQGALIARAALEGGAQPVAVFVSELPEEIEKACRAMNICTVQCYLQDISLPSFIHRFYVNEPKAHLRPEQDYLLMEGSRPGCGEKIDPNHFIRPVGKAFFVAGGLNPSNVRETIRLYNPIGVDVSSGVEKDQCKNKELISEFIKKVRSDEFN